MSSANGSMVPGLEFKTSRDKPQDELGKQKVRHSQRPGRGSRSDIPHVLGTAFWSAITQPKVASRAAAVVPFGEHHTHLDMSAWLESMAKGII